MNRNDERLLQLDVDNLCSGLHELRHMVARIEAKLDAMMSAFSLYGLAKESEGGKLAEALATVEDGLDRRLEEIHRRAEEGDD